MADHNPSEPDVLIIGAGIAGLWCGYFLSRAGLRVTVLDRSAVGDPSASSSGNTGFLGTGGLPLAGPGALAAGLRSLLRPDDRLALPPTVRPDRLRWLRQFRRAGSPEQAARSMAGMLALKRRSWQLMRELALPGFTASGMLHLYRTEEGLARARAGLPRLVESGVPMRELTAEQLRELEPDTDFAVAGALFNPDAGYFAAPEFSVALARALTEAGATIMPDVAVTGFRTSAGSITEVGSSAGGFRPAEVLLAAGSWSGRLARLLALDLPIQPVKGYSITVKAPADAPRHPVLLAEGMVAVRPFGDRLRFAGDLSLAGWHPTVSRRRVDRMLTVVRTQLPALEWTEQEVWAGFRPCTPDSLPLLGRAPGYTNLTIATGHGHNGMALAPAAGELVTRSLLMQHGLLTDQGEIVDASLFQVDRYTTSRRER
ncbi:MAG TPA: FAD-dependent oxidoreductase [Jatrophihabitans sp.]|nr:FAD-dependent oxidoreductase [Jatrophihabitans sp.]